MNQFNYYQTFKIIALYVKTIFMNFIMNILIRIIYKYNKNKLYTIYDEDMEAQQLILNYQSLNTLKYIYKYEINMGEFDKLNNMEKLKKYRDYYNIDFNTGIIISHSKTE